MSFFDLLKKIFKGNDNDDLFVPVESVEKPKKEKHTPPKNENSTEYTSEYIGLFNEHSSVLEIVIPETTVEETTEQNVVEIPIVQDEDSGYKPINPKNFIELRKYNTTYIIKVDKSMQDKMYYKFIIYLNSTPGNSAYGLSSMRVIQGSTIYEQPFSLWQIVIERELYELFKLHKSRIGEELSNDMKINILKEVQQLAVQH